MTDISRKEFLQTLAAAGTAAAFSSVGALDLMAQNAGANGAYNLVAVMGGEPDVMFDMAIEQMGGMKRFVKPGMKVTIKPNIGWDKTPELSANTNPILVSAIIKACWAAGAKEITIFDHTCDEWRRCYQSSGIEEAAKKLGAKVVPGNEPEYYREIQLPRYEKPFRRQNDAVHEKPHGNRSGQRVHAYSRPSANHCRYLHD